MENITFKTLDQKIQMAQRNINSVFLRFPDLNKTQRPRKERVALLNEISQKLIQAGTLVAEVVSYKEILSQHIAELPEEFPLFPSTVSVPPPPKHDPEPLKQDHIQVTLFDHSAA